MCSTPSSSTLVTLPLRTDRGIRDGERDAPDGPASRVGDRCFSMGWLLLKPEADDGAVVLGGVVFSASGVADVVASTGVMGNPK